MNLRERAVLFLATGGFIGRMPFAPGTFGALWGLPLGFLLSKAGTGVAVLLLAAGLAPAAWICREAEGLIKETDPGCVVLDEIFGMTVALTGIPFDPAPVAAGFIFFRLLDILKPFPIRAFEKWFSGGWAILLDDIAAGFFTNLLLRAIVFLFGTKLIFIHF